MSELCSTPFSPPTNQCEWRPYPGPNGVVWQCATCGCWRSERSDIEKLMDRPRARY